MMGSNPQLPEWQRALRALDESWSRFLSDNGFPDDIGKAVRVALAELGEFCTLQEAENLPLDNVRELLETVVDRRKWLASQTSEKDFAPTPERRSPSQWQYLLRHLNDGDALSPTTWRRWTRGEPAKIRTVVHSSRSVQVDEKLFPKALGTPELRDEDLRSRR